MQGTIRRRNRGRPSGTLAVTLLSAAPACVQAAQSAPAVEAFGVVKVLFGLGVVLAAVVGAAWLARRFSPQTMGGTWMRVQGAVAVGARERIMLLEIKETWLVIGVAPGHVNLLHSLPRPAEADQIAQRSPDKPNFSAWLKHTLERRNHA